MHPRSRAVTALTLAATAALLAPAPAAADRTTHSTLRVEAGGKALVDEVNYSNGAIRSRNSNRCGERNSRAERLGAGTATGLLANAAAANRRLRPFRTSDTFEFGLIVCAVGAFKGFEQASWLYKVNHELATVGGEQLRVGRGDDVLWYFSNFESGRNSGAELELTDVPARAAPGQRFSVRVVAYDGDGRATPAAGVQVTGAAAPTGADGRTMVAAGDAGQIRLRGARGDDIPTQSARVCVSARASSCPSVSGESFVGTDDDDRIRATRGADVVRAGAGDDLVSARGGGSDRVNCGPGRDRARVDRSDEVARNCERARR